MALSNYQLVLLDNLIYLGIFEELVGEKEGDLATVGRVVDRLLNGEIKKYWKDELKKDQSDENPGQCLMKEDEWRAVLQSIADDGMLCSLIISNVVDADTDPKKENTNFRAACFSSEDETVIVFRGTHGAYAWDDNGTGGYLADTNSQLEALEYVNKIGAELSTNGTITVTGHSKGGSLAQYVTICANNLTVDRCLSFDGQGFSNEFIEKYEVAILVNQDKLYSINSEKDFVNALLNTLVPEGHRMYVKANEADDLFGYHKPNNILHIDEDGKPVKAIGLNGIANQGVLAEFINMFTCFVIDYKKDDADAQLKKANTFDTLLGYMEANADPNDDKKPYLEVFAMDIVTYLIDDYIDRKTPGKEIALYLFQTMNPSWEINGIQDLYQLTVQEDARSNQLENAVLCVGEYLKAFFDQTTMEEGWICALMEELKPGISEELWKGLSIGRGTGIGSSSGEDKYYTLEEFYSKEMAQYADYANFVNEKYAKTTTLGQNYQGSEAADIIVADGQVVSSDNISKKAPMSSVSGNEKDNAIIGNEIQGLYIVLIVALLITIIVPSASNIDRRTLYFLVGGFMSLIYFAILKIKK